MVEQTKSNELACLSEAFGPIDEVPLIGDLVGHTILELVATGLAVQVPGSTSGIIQNDGRFFPNEKYRVRDLYNKYCREIWNTPKGKKICQACDCQAVQMLVKKDDLVSDNDIKNIMREKPIKFIKEFPENKTYCYQCCAGLLELIRPITLDYPQGLSETRYIGAMWASKYKVAENFFSDEEIYKFAKQIDYQDPENLIKLHKEINPIETQKIDECVHILSEAASSIEGFVSAAFHMRRRNEENKFLFQSVAHQVFRPIMQLEQSAYILLNRPCNSKILDSFYDCIMEMKRGARNFSYFLKSTEEANKGQEHMDKCVNLDINTLLQNAIERVKHYLKLEKRELQIYPLPEDLCTLEVVNDKDILECLVNVLHNAIKYSIGKDPVEVQVAVSLTSLDIRVSNIGVEIPRDSWEKVFQPTVRLETAKTVSIEGSGLGLYIVKQLLEKQSGNIVVESCNPVYTTDESEKRWKTTFLISLKYRGTDHV